MRNCKLLDFKHKKHSSRMRTARSSPWRGRGSLTEAPLDRPPGLPDRAPPGQRPPWPENPRTETPLARETPLDREPPEGIWDQAARQEVTSHRHTETPRGQTNNCENITLLQTSFVGGSNTWFKKGPPTKKRTKNK